MAEPVSESMDDTEEVAPEHNSTRADNPPASGKKSVTLRDVAAMAGVSVMTVSNVINRRSKAVSDITRNRVELAIKKVNYRPHSSGRKLRLSQRFSIGMIIVDESPAFLADPFITQLLAGLSNFLSERGYGLTVQGIAQKKLQDALVVRNQEADAICIMLSGDPRVRRQDVEVLQLLGQPIVLFQERARAGPDVCSIRQQDRLGASQLARYLLDRGARKIVFLAPAASWPAIEERLKGARETVRQTGAASIALIGCGKGDLSDTQTAIRRHVSEQGVPDAIMGGNDQMGIAALKWAKEQRLDVPGNLLVTGFNAFDFRQYSDPVLTSVRSPAYEMGRRGGEVILDRLSRGSFVDREIILPVRFLHGASA